MKSIRIIKLNFVLTIFIILLHGHVPVGESKLCLTNSPLWYDLFEHFIVNVFCTAVPTFFAISAYLLFRNYNNIFDYKKKVVSRIYSLVIPYLCFSLFFLVLFNILFFIKDGEIRTTSLYTILMDTYTCKYDSPIWYIRALFYFVLCSPILLYIFLINSIYINVLILLISLIVPLFLNIPYDTFFYWLPILIVFSYIGYKYPNLFFKENLVGKNISIISLIIFVFLCCFMNEDDDKSYGYWIFRMILPFLFIMIMELFNFKEKPYFNMTFFWYMLHGAFPPIAYQIFNPTTGNLWYVILTPVFVTSATILVTLFIKSFFPNLFIFLSGNRK